jgi:hypothetical protein
MNGYSVDDLIKLAAAGGGFALNASGFSRDDLIRIADAASVKQARVTFRGLRLPVNDMITIAAAGKGAVFFE